MKSGPLTVQLFRVGLLVLVFGLALLSQGQHSIDWGHLMITLMPGRWLLPRRPLSIMKSASAP